MSIIIISSDSFKEGEKLAERTAETLGHVLLGRDLLKRVAEKDHLPEKKLAAALDKPITTLGMPAKARKRYLARIQEAVLGELLSDNIVCYGLAAHLYVLGVSHTLRVRILSDPDKLAQAIADEASISVEKAGKRLLRDKRQRRQWSQDMFKIDETDASRYDLMINLNQIGENEAIDIINKTVSSRKFTPMSYSVKCLRDLELAARVRAALAEKFPNVRVKADGGMVVVETLGLKREKRKKESLIKEKVSSIPGVDYLEIHFINDFFRQAVESFR